VGSPDPEVYHVRSRLRAAAARAALNHENVVVLRDMPQIARLYQQEWERLWNESQDW
jgi:hypothetical protein